ncbi:hypothetical protein HPP92_013446 [Vanilla planifolia]|uniref:Pentatricopeptide repeat-containing protein n=1 Tax=Vanilla planifolia TaxID=51239 RepID=A0A835UY04_VANPL|nr:hypothetical protein HPP92_013446 [Vanilla planifolia]
MISGHAQNGLMSRAQDIFKTMPEHDVISWNSMISGYFQNGNLRESARFFIKMKRTSIKPDRTTFAIVLKLSSFFEEFEMGIQIHGLVRKMGLDLDVVTGSALIDMYAKCGYLDESLSFFYGMTNRNWVTWSAIIGGCAQNLQFIVGLGLFLEMQREGIGVSQSSYASIFRSCAGLSSLEAGRQLHGHATKNNYITDVVVGTSILDMYAKCHSLDDAIRVFWELPNCSLQTFNAMLVGFSRHDQGVEALKLFKFMNRSGLVADEISISAVLSACAEAKAYLQGLQVHCLAIKTHLFLNICVINATLDMYGKCGSLFDAWIVFEEMDRRDAVSWNAIITAFEQNGFYEETLSHFNQMLLWGLEPDVFTYGSVLKACTALQSLNCGMRVHEKIIKSGLGSDAFLGGALIDMYCKCGMLEEARTIHCRIEFPTMVSWNAIISGFSLQKRSEDAQIFFDQMLQMGLEPDNFTYATILDTCSNLTMVGLGKQIHAQIIKLDFHHKDVFISSTLVDMYAKCGNMEDSQLMFDKMLERDSVSWNAIICGYANHGLGKEALKMFESMGRENFLPNHATFVGVLRACAHSGLAEEGLRYFKSMKKINDLEPQLEHYSCMVDLLGRSKGVHEALNVINEMPYRADAIIWRTLLSVCQIHRNVEVAELAVKKILLLEPSDSSACVLLSNIYAEAERWEEVSRMRKMMRQSSMKKEPGCSWIEVNSKMHIFVVGDSEHPKYEQINKFLDDLAGEMSMLGYDLDEETIYGEANIGIESPCQSIF